MDINFQDRIDEYLLFIRVICSLAFIIFQVGRMGVVLFLPSIALNVVTGLDLSLIHI